MHAVLGKKPTRSHPPPNPAAQQRGVLPLRAPHQERHLRTRRARLRRHDTLPRPESPAVIRALRWLFSDPLVIAVNCALFVNNYRYALWYALQGHILAGAVVGAVGLLNLAVVFWLVERRRQRQAGQHG